MNPQEEEKNIEIYDRYRRWGQCVFSHSLKNYPKCWNQIKHVETCCTKTCTTMDYGFISQLEVAYVVELLP